MSNTLIFAIIGLVLLIAEVAAPGFVLLPIGVAFLLTAPIAYFSPNIEIPLIALAILAPLCLIVIRKIFKKHSKATVPSNFEGMAGKVGIVEEDIAPGARGYVKVYGDSWKVEGLTSETLTKDTKVVIDRVEGTKIFVRKV